MKKNVLLFLIFVFNFSVFAENFSFQIFQHSKGISFVFEEVFEFEDELLNCFFSSGDIVSNEPAVISVSEKKDSSVISKSINSAFEGGLDNFCEIHIYFDISKDFSKENVFAFLDKIVLKISSAINPKKAEEKNISVNKPFSSDQEAFLKDLVFEVASGLQKSLKSRA